MENKTSSSRKRSRSRVCSVIGCNNGDYQLSKWREEICKIHNEPQESCGCDPPFSLFTFPTRKTNPTGRDTWKKLLNRVKPDQSPWTPGKQSRVCSRHFKDKQPTVRIAIIAIEGA